MNINRYALCKERSLQKIIKNQPKPNTTAIGVCSETQVTHHNITKRNDECLPISAFVPKHKEGDDKKFPVIIDIYGGNFVAGRSALNTNFGAWCAEQGYLTFIPEYTPVPETNLFGQLGNLLKAFVVIHRCAERYGADMSRMYLVGDDAGAALACLVYALLWNPVSMQHLEVDCPSHLIRDADVLRRKGISVTRISAFAKPEDTQRFVCKHPNLIKQVEKGTNMFDVFVFPIDCITRIRAGEKVLWTNPTT